MDKIEELKDALDRLNAWRSDVKNTFSPLWSETTELHRKLTERLRT